MVLTLERQRFIHRVPGQARSTTLIIPPESSPRTPNPEPRPLTSRLWTPPLLVLQKGSELFVFASTLRSRPQDRIARSTLNPPDNRSTHQHAP
jgi:hypothetical protein